MQHLVCEERHPQTDLATPKSKQWHCIDYAIMRKAHRRRCLDATVMRGAQCNTDHMMLKVKL